MLFKQDLLPREWRCLFIVLTVWSVSATVAVGENVAAPEACQNILVRISYGQPFPEDAFQLRLLLMNDVNDLLAQITALQEESKQKLEPLVKIYMYAAEALTRLTMIPSDEKAQFIQQFRETEQQIEEVLAEYRKPIDILLNNATIMSKTYSAWEESFPLHGIELGIYRVYAELSFSTTTLHWFEPLKLKGGGDSSVVLTRDNLNNPYWTDLNWWSFMNLDFSKHH